MDQKQRVLEQLQAGKSWKEVSTQSGKSSVYEGVTMFFQWAEPEVEKRQTNLSALSEQIVKLELKKAKLNTDVESLGSAYETSKSRQLDLDGANSKVEGELSAKQSQLDKINTGLTSLKEKGITQEIVENAAATDAGNPVEFLDRISTVAGAEAEKRKGEALAEANLKLEAENLAKAKNLGVLTRNVASEKNQLDEFKRETYMYRGAQKNVLYACSRGYSFETQDNVYRALHKFEVKGQPNTSINRLIKGLEEVQELTELKTAKIEIETEILQAKKELSQVKGTVKAMVDTVVPSLQAAQNQCINSIHVTQNSAIEEMMKLTKHHQISINTAEHTAEKKIDQLLGLVNAQTQNISRWTSENLMKITMSFDTLDADIQKWGILQQSAGKLQTTIEWGDYIQLLMNKPLTAAKMPPDFALKVVEWAQIWIQKNLPEATTLPPQQVTAIDRTLASYWPSHLTSLIEWIRWDLAERKRKGEI